MPVFNYAKKEVNVKVVYYGPGLSGKTTNLQQIHEGIKPEFKGKLVSLATQTDRTLFFDFMPLELGSLGGYKIRLHLYTVPGQVHYNATRKLVLKGVDGVVFVADSQCAMGDANVESFLNLEKNFQSYGKTLKDLPHVIQANKRDLEEIFPMEEIGALLNHYGAPLTEAVASEGTGVLETLTEIVRMVMKDLRDQFRSQAEERTAVSDTATAPPPEPASPSAEASSFAKATEDKTEDRPAPETESETVSETHSLPPLGEEAAGPLSAPLDGQEEDPTLVPLDFPDVPHEDEKILLDDEVSATTDEPSPQVSETAHDQYDPTAGSVDLFAETDDDPGPEEPAPKKKGLFDRFKKKK